MLKTNIRSYINKLLGSLGYEIKRKRNVCSYLEAIGIAPKIIFDVGVCIGETIHMFHESFPDARIIGFEPFPEFFSKSQSRFKDNKYVELYPFAMSDHEGHHEMYIENYNCSLQSPLHNNNNSLESNQNKIVIKTELLDSFAEKHIPNQNIDLLKIDVEGHEREALKGASHLLSTGRVKAILIEVMFYPHFDNAWLSHDIESYLASHGFIQHQLFDIKLTQSGQMRYANALFVWRGSIL